MKTLLRRIVLLSPALLSLMIVHGSAQARTALPGALVQDEGDAQEVRETNGTWLNYIGEHPTKRTLDGRCQVLLFFSQKDFEGGKVNWAQIERFHDSYEGKIAILGIYSGSSSSAERMLDQNNMFFPVGIRTDFVEAYRIGSGSNHLLIDREGGIYWQGPLGGLWEGKMLKPMRGSRQVHEEAALVLHVERDFEGRLGTVQNKLAAGDLSRSYLDLESILKAPRTSEEEKTGAQWMLARIRGHVQLVLEQLDDLIELRDVARVDRALTALVKDLKRTPLGEPFIKLQAQLKKDEAFQRELKADEEFARIFKDYWKRGPSKSKPKIKRIIEKFDGTRGAEKARNLSLGR